MDAQQLEFADGSFDVMDGSGKLTFSRCTKIQAGGGYTILDKEFWNEVF